MKSCTRAAAVLLTCKSEEKLQHWEGQEEKESKEQKAGGCAARSGQGRTGALQREKEE